MGTVTAICISKQRGTPKQPVSSAQFVPDYGIGRSACCSRKRLTPFGNAAWQLLRVRLEKILR